MINILMIDDDEDDFMIISQLLNDISGNNYHVEWASSYKEGVRRATDRKYDIYLVDYRLSGQTTGIDFLHYLESIHYDVPVIMLTGRGDYEVDQKSMEAGAVDYLVKGEFNGAVLERSIRYALEQYEHIKAIAENERKYFSVFEKSRDLILLADCDNNIIDINPAALFRLKYSKEELLHRSLERLFYYPEEWKVFFNHICGEDEVIDTEFVLKTKTGEKLYVQMNVSMQDHEQKIFQCIMHDISKRRESEHEKSQIEKFAATGRIARIMAHEVRNPLTNIGLSLNELKSSCGSLNPDSQICLDIIERNYNRISQLITELLNSTRFSELYISMESLHDLLNDALQQANDRIQLKQIKVKRQYAPEDMKVPVDRDKIMIAFLNIIINAVEAMEATAGELTVRTEQQGNRAIIRIQDTGAGIDSDTLSKIFEPFFTSKSGGNGLGLTNTQNIIFNHGGSISVDSEVGNGTVFTIMLPMEKINNLVKQ